MLLIALHFVNLQEGKSNLKETVQVMGGIKRYYFNYSISLRNKY